MIIGLDVGGTHTDVILVDRNGLIKEIKVPTDSSDLFKSVLAGLTAITEDHNPEKINRIVLSTTLTTNTIVQGKTPAVLARVNGPIIDRKGRTSSTHSLFCRSVQGSESQRAR